MSDISLSIIIPVYNTEKFLKKCLDSVLKAVEVLGKKSEIIVINDGSLGNCDKIMEEYSNNYIIRYIKQDNRGRGATRNLGLREAKGEYVTFVDSDDYIDEDMYKDMFLDVDANEADLVICDVQSVDETTGDKILLIPGINPSIQNIRIACFDVMMLPSCVNKIFKKELFDGLKFPENINYEDLATIPAVYLKAKNIRYVNRAHYYYVQNSNSIMNQDYNVEKLNILEALNIVFERIDKLNLENNINEISKYSLFTRRYYEEILEKIALSSNKDELIKVFIEKAQNLIVQMKNNEYLRKEISSCGYLKKCFNYRLFNYIENEKISKIYSYLKINNYYRLIAIIYCSKSLQGM